MNVYLTPPNSPNPVEYAAQIKMPLPLTIAISTFSVGLFYGIPSILYYNRYHEQAAKDIAIGSFSMALLSLIFIVGKVFMIHKRPSEIQNPEAPEFRFPENIEERGLLLP